MTRCHVLALTLLALLPLPVLPAQAPGRRAQPVSRDTARAAQKEFLSEYRSKDERIRLAAVDRVVPYRHDLVVACLSRALRDPEPEVRAAAARGLALQERKPAAKALLAAFGDRRTQREPEAMVAVLEALRAHRVSPRLRAMRKLFDDAPKEVQREVLRALRWSRTRDTVEFLGSLLDMPEPANVDSPTNPPASYWKKKQRRWAFWIGSLLETVLHLTGKAFDSEEQVEDWLKKGGRPIPPEEGEKALEDL